MLTARSSLALFCYPTLTSVAPGTSSSARSELMYVSKSFAFAFRTILACSCVEVILLNGCTTCTLTNHLEKRLNGNAVLNKSLGKHSAKHSFTVTNFPSLKLDGNHKRILRGVLNKFWNQHLTKQQLYGHLRPISQTIRLSLMHSLITMYII